MDKKKRTFGIIIAALLVVGSIGIGISQGDVGSYGEATGGDGSKGVYGIATNTAMYATMAATLWLTAVKAWVFMEEVQKADTSPPQRLEHCITGSLE
jgi:hypothetical protein